MSNGMNIFERVTRFIWVRIPLLVARRWPGAGIVLGDGHYLGRWWYVAIPAIPIAGAGGMAAGAMHDGRTFTYSMLVMAVLAVAGQAGACLGLWATIGYAIGDLFLNDAPREGGLLTGTVPDLIAYVWLGLLTVVLPVLVLATRRGMPMDIPRVPQALMPWLSGLSAAIVAGGGAYLWAKAAPLVTQPIFTWTGRLPEELALRPLRENWWVLVLAAGWAAVARVVAEHEAVSDKVVELSQELWNGLLDRFEEGPRTGIDGLIVVGTGAIGTTLMFSGLIGSYLQAFVVLVFLGSLLFVRFFLVSASSGAVGLLTRVPLPVRLLIAAGLTYGFGRVVVAFLTSHTSAQLPMLLSACVAALLVTLLGLPRPARRAEVKDSSEPPAW
jgi:hypothetical protein